VSLRGPAEPPSTSRPPPPPFHWPRPVPQGLPRPRPETLTGVAIVAQAEFRAWLELKAQQFQGWQGAAERGELGADVNRGLKAASAGWSHLGPGRAAWGENTVKESDHQLRNG
jgi:hypothetical protein